MRAGSVLHSRLIVIRLAQHINMVNIMWRYESVTSTTIMISYMTTKIMGVKSQRASDD